MHPQASALTHCNECLAVHLSGILPLLIQSDLGSSLIVSLSRNVPNAQAKLRAEGAPLATYSLARGVTAGAVSFSLLLGSYKYLLSHIRFLPMTLEITLPFGKRTNFNPSIISFLHSPSCPMVILHTFSISTARTPTAPAFVLK